MSTKIPLPAILLIAILASPATTFSQIYANSLDKIPAGWKGPVFQLSKDYPTTLPIEKNKPWLNYDFTSQPKEYINAVLAYFLEGNREANWVVQNNKIRKWYHAPSMIWQPHGREFIHGLTRERSSPPGELYPTQDSIIQNWAVGFYNPAGAYTFGQVWADTTNLQIDNVSFPEGTVTAKLLFTAAAPAKVPYINGSLEWQGNINTAVSGTNNRSPQTVRLLQLDIAVKDARADSLTGWVFGTFAYHVNAPGATLWEKLVPVGLMWGNDPKALASGALTQSWINPDFVSLFTFPNGKTMHVGYNGRLNGPVDNPRSSCMSCHATAQSPPAQPMTPNIKDPSSLAKYFRNVKSGQLFSPPGKSLDYSLQLSGGVAAVLARHAAIRSAETKALPVELNKIAHYITSLEEELPVQQPDSTQVKPAKGKSDLPLSQINKLLWVIGVVLIVVIGAFAYTNRKNKK